MAADGVVARAQTTSACTRTSALPATICPVVIGGSPRPDRRLRNKLLGPAYRQMPTTENKQNLKQIHDGPYISLMRASPRFLGALPATFVAAALILPATLPTAAGAATPPAAAVSTAAAIGGNSGGASPRSDPNDEADLPDTISALTTTSHNVAMTTPSSTIKGSVDPAAKAAAIVATSGDLEVDEVVDDGQVWLKMDLGKDANSQLGISGNDWMALDPQKLSANNNLPIHADASDPIDMAGIL